MKRLAVFAAAFLLSGAAAPPPPPPPIANYWMDAGTASGMGAGMTPGSRPNMAQIMQMMQGGGSEAQHTLNLYLASRHDSPAPEAQHLIPPGMQMGASLPLIAPPAPKQVHEPENGLPPNFQRPKGRMLIFWGCGEHAGAGQPTVIDFSKLAAGQVPSGFAAMASTIHAAQPPRPGQTPGFGEWPNEKDSRPLPPGSSLIGAHDVESNYAPKIAFALNQGQDFMPGLGLREAGKLPSGANPMSWTPAPQATGYALAMFGSSGGGDVVVWTSSNKAAAFPILDYLSPSQVKTLVANGEALAPTTSQCTIPAEVAAASPMGMVMMIGYGPEAYFSDNPKAPTWTVRVRYKSTATVMPGMAGMYGDAGAAQQPQQAPAEQQPKKKKGFGLGDLLSNVPHR